jgi:hypothetical protein
MAKRFAEWVVRNRWIVVIATLALVAVFAAGVKRLSLTTDYRVFFSKENPQLAAFEKLQNTYTKNDNVVIVLAPRDGRVFTPGTLGAIHKLTQAAWQTPYSIRVDSITNFQNTRGVGDDLIVKDLVPDPETMLPSDIDAARGIAVNEPLLVHRLISPTADVTAVNITIQTPEKDPRTEIPAVVTHVRGLVEKMQAEHPDIGFHLTGTVMMNNAFPEAQRHDMRTLVPIMFLVVIGLLYVLMRHASGVFVTVLVIAFSIIGGMGLWGWVSGRLTPPTASVPTIILTLAVADCVHILMSFLHYWRTGYDKQGAMVEALRVNLQPVFLTSFTTAIGFLSMNFSDSPPFRDMGNMVAIGIGLAFVFAITFLPALVMILPGKSGRERATDHAMMTNLGEFVLRHRHKLLVGSAIVTVVLGFAITRNELNDAFVEYFGKNMKFRQDTDFMTDHLTGIYNIDFSLSAGEPEGVSDPAFLAKVEEFANWFRTQPEVVHVNTFTDIMKRLNKNMHGDDPAWYRLPEQRDLAAQYLLLYEMSLPFGLDLNNQLNVDKSSTRVSVTLKNITTNEMLALEQRGRDWLQKNAPPSMMSEGASPAIMFAHIGARTIKSMWSGNAIGIALISLTLVITLRSLKFGLVSMIPNVLPAILAFGIWGLTVGQVGLSLSVVFSMTLGIVVDDTIHFLSKYLRARREQGMGAEEAVRYVFESVGTALWVTTVILVAGFAVLAMSDFKMNSGMGTLSAVTIALALAADFLLLPPLVLLLKEKRNEKAASPVAA